MSSGIIILILILIASVVTLFIAVSFLLIHRKKPGYYKADVFVRSEV
jgi:hypothetical protein